MEVPAKIQMEDTDAAAMLDTLETTVKNITEFAKSKILAKTMENVRIIGKHYVISNTAVTKQDFLQILIF